MDIFLALIAGFFGGVPAALLTNWLTEKRRSDPLAISLRLRQLEVAADLYTRMRPLVEATDDYIQERQLLMDPRTLEERPLGRAVSALEAIEDSFRAAYVYLPIEVMAHFVALKQLCNDTVSHGRPHLDEQLPALEKLDQLEVDILNAIRRELQVKELSKIPLLKVSDYPARRKSEQPSTPESNEEVG